MKAASDIFEQLDGISGAGDDFVLHAYRLTDKWRAVGVGIEAVDPILRFMENEPDVDFGAPGPLAHFMEQFQGRGYDERLLESVKRKPTYETAGLLNRLINGASSDDARRRLIEVMEQARRNPRADVVTIERLEEALKLQRRRRNQGRN